MPNEQIFDRSNLINLANSLNISETVHEHHISIRKIKPPSSLSNTQAASLMTLNDLDNLSRLLQEELECYESSKEFWMATWKTSPYALLPLISISAIVSYVEDIVDNWWIVLVPFLVTAFIGGLGYVGYKRQLDCSKYISLLKKKNNEISHEIGRRESLINEFIRANRFDPEQVSFSGYKFPYMEFLPDSMPDIDIKTVFDGSSSKNTRKTGRYSDILHRYPDVIGSYELYKQKIVEYYMELQHYSRLVMGANPSSDKHIYDATRGLMITYLGFINLSCNTKVDVLDQSQAALVNERMRVNMDAWRSIVSPNGNNHWLYKDDIKEQGLRVVEKRDAVNDAKVEFIAVLVEYFGPRQS